MKRRLAVVYLFVCVFLGLCGLSHSSNEKSGTLWKRLKHRAVQGTNFLDLRGTFKTKNVAEVKSALERKKSNGQSTTDVKSALESKRGVRPPPRDDPDSEGSEATFIQVYQIRDEQPPLLSEEAKQNCVRAGELGTRITSLLELNQATVNGEEEDDDDNDDSAPEAINDGAENRTRRGDKVPAIVERDNEEDDNDEDDDNSTSVDNTLSRLMKGKLLLGFLEVNQRASQKAMKGRGGRGEQRRKQHVAEQRKKAESGKKEGIRKAENQRKEASKKSIKAKHRKKISRAKKERRKC